MTLSVMGVCTQKSNLARPSFKTYQFMEFTKSKMKINMKSTIDIAKEIGVNINKDGQAFFAAIEQLEAFRKAVEADCADYLRSLILREIP